MTDADPQQSVRRPLGWWLKEADRALDRGAARTLDGSGVDRRQWQVLASLADGPRAEAEVLGELRSFDRAPEAVEHLLAGGLVERSGDRLALTAEGVSVQRAVAARVDALRARVAGALPDDGYAQLVQLLAQVVGAVPEDQRRR